MGLERLDEKVGFLARHVEDRRMVQRRAVAVDEEVDRIGAKPRPRARLNVARERDRGNRRGRRETELSGKPVAGGP